MKQGTARRANILIIDDMPSNVEVLGNVLSENYEIRFAISGKEGIELARRFPTDLILLDVMMPEMDGYETCRRLKEDPALARIPVIFVSAMSETEAETRGLQIGAEDYLVKPINNEIARLRINNAIERDTLKRELELSLDASNQGLWEWDLEREQVVFNRKWAAPLGYASGEMFQNCVTWEQIAAPQHIEKIKQSYNALISDKTNTMSLDIQLRNKSDTWSWVHLEGKVTQLDDAARPVSIIGTYINIDNRMETEKALENERISLQTLLASMQDTVLTIDVFSIVTRCHSSIEQVLLQSNNGCLGTDYHSLMDPDTAYAIENAITEVIEKEEPQQIECRVVKNGKTWFYNVTVSVLGAIDDPSGFLIVGRDITRLMESEEEIRRLAYVDSLTQLPNRRLLMDRLEQAVRNSQRNKEHGAVMFIDLDRFKELNDTYGHEKGDQLLIEVASRLQNTVRNNDTVARLGGDEFVVLMEQLSVDEAQAKEDAAVIGKKILQALNVDYQLDELSYKSTPSIGIKLFFGEEKDSSHILTCADKAMYHAKQSGRNALCFFDDLSPET